MIRTMFFCMAAVVWGCGNCLECPPCQDEKTQKGTDETESYSDAGIDAPLKGGKPKPVNSFDLFGRAGFHKVNIFEKPDMDSPILGYMRKGRRTRLGNPQYASESCPSGWFALREGGFVCQGRGMLVGTKPRYIHGAPPEPLIDELDPYRHGFIRKDWTPMYKRIPALEELWTPPTQNPEGEENSDAGPETAPSEIAPHSKDEADGGVNYYEYAKKQFKAVRTLLSHGFWISVAERVFDDKNHKYYYETIKGDYVPGEAVHLVKPTRFKGYEVLGDSPLPAAIVTDRHASFYQMKKGKFQGAGPVERLSTYRVLKIAESAKTKYYKIEGDRWIKSTQAQLFELRKPPEGMGDKEKWIRIDLSSQTLEAYEGTMPVYVTLISSGLPDSEETVTPRGRFRIMFKHITDDMTGTVGDDDAYSVEDVPWVQYIHQNVALHASFWHSQYGTPKSHGCINISPSDARILFDWTEPKLPVGWHGINATEKNKGTLVIIEGKTPAK